MRFMHRIPSLIVVIVMGSLLVACGGGGGGGGGAPGDSDKTQSTATATAVGVPDGTATTVSIGSGGGTLVSSDSKVRLDIPAGALSASTPITIQPITNFAHGRLGKAYRLTPDGQTFSLPVKIVFSYSDADLVGTVPELLASVFQDSQGNWNMMKNVTVDAVAKTITVETTHFSDWSLVTKVRLEPPTAVAGVNQTVRLRLLGCRPASQPADDEEIFLPRIVCEQMGSVLGGWAAQDWYVNGTVGGNSTVGNVEAAEDDLGQTGAATYRAPASAPLPDTVAVSVDIVDAKTRAKMLLFSRIRIVDSPVLVMRGTYQATTQFGSAAISSTDTITLKINRGPFGFTAPYVYGDVPGETGTAPLVGDMVVNGTTAVGSVTHVNEGCPSPVLTSPREVITVTGMKYTTNRIWLYGVGQIPSMELDWGNEYCATHQAGYSERVSVLIDLTPTEWDRAFDETVYYTYQGWSWEIGPANPQ